MRIAIRFTVLLILFFCVIWFFDIGRGTSVATPDVAMSHNYNDKSDQSPNTITSFLLPVPYISEAPEGDWSGDWVNACEEATIAMVDNYYKNGGEVSISHAKNYLQNLFAKENDLYGHNKNTDAHQILELINFFGSFKAEIKTNPTIENIKTELLDGRPIISLHRGFDLKNVNIPFSPTKSSYHTIVVVGFDDITSEFITHDPGDDKDGVNHRYSYSDFMFSLHDYNKDTDKTDGVATVLFTRGE